MLVSLLRTAVSAIDGVAAEHLCSLRSAAQQQRPSVQHQPPLSAAAAADGRYALRVSGMWCYLLYDDVAKANSGFVGAE